MGGSDPPGLSPEASGNGMEDSERTFSIREGHLPQPPPLALASQPRTNIHGQVHPEVHVLGPGLLHWVLTHHGEDAAVQVGLASCLVIPGHSNDGGSGAVPSHLMCRPEMRDRQDH